MQEEQEPPDDYIELEADQVDPPDHQVDPGDLVDQQGHQVDPPGHQVDPGDLLDRQGHQVDPPGDVVPEQNEPPVPRLEDTVHDEWAQVIVEGQQLQMHMVHVEPHDHHHLPPPHPADEPDLPFPIQVTKQGMKEAAQLVLPHT